MCSNPRTTEEVKTKIDDIKGRIIDLERKYPHVYQPLKPLLMDLLDWLESADAVIARQTRELYQLKKTQPGMTITINGKEVQRVALSDE
jgi:hypothetical protein